MENIIYDSTKKIETIQYDLLEQSLKNIKYDDQLFRAGTIQRWNSSSTGFMDVYGMENIIYPMETQSYIYVIDDGDDLKVIECHHDGTNEYYFRLLPKSTDFDNISTEDVIDKGKSVRDLVIESFKQWVRYTEA